MTAPDPARPLVLQVEQPTALEWAEIADNCFKRDDLVRMEWLVMDHLGWRGRTPTPYSFLHLYCYGLASCPAQTICLASYVTVGAGPSFWGCGGRHGSTNAVVWERRVRGRGGGGAGGEVREQLSMG